MDQEKKHQSVEKEIGIDGTLPHQINAPDYKKSTRTMQKPFVNQYGVVIGDSFYDSPQSPLNNWSTDVDPSVMAGDEWVHPTNDIGFNTTENRELLEDNEPPQGAPFMHPTIDVSHGKD